MSSSTAEDTKVNRQSKIFRADVPPDVSKKIIARINEGMDKSVVEKDVATFVKKKCDEELGGTWHCVAGRNFGCSITHDTKFSLFLQVKDFHPTQICVGEQAVLKKKKKVKKMLQKPSIVQHQFFTKYGIPGVWGPNEKFYIIDHHHMGRAMHLAKVKECICFIMEDLSHLPIDEFWRVMESKHWVYPFDKDGNKQDYSKIPASVKDLENDPYRTLAQLVKKSYGWYKPPVAEAPPFLEFAWANFFRSKVPIEGGDKVKKHHVDLACGAAHSSEAEHVVGYWTLEAADVQKRADAAAEVSGKVPHQFPHYSIEELERFVGGASSSSGGDCHSDSDEGEEDKAESDADSD